MADKIEFSKIILNIYLGRLKILKKKFDNPILIVYNITTIVNNYFLNKFAILPKGGCYD